jgi:hypothetical protein
MDREFKPSSDAREHVLNNAFVLVITLIWGGVSVSSEIFPMIPFVFGEVVPLLLQRRCAFPEVLLDIFP